LRRKIDFNRWLWTTSVRRPRRTQLVSNPEIAEIDKLAGDHHYVFLAPWPYRENAPFPAYRDEPKLNEVFWHDWGFGFDAEELILQGAILGVTDLLHTYEVRLRDALYEAVLPYAHGYNDAERAYSAKRFVDDSASIINPEAIRTLKMFNGVPIFRRLVAQLQSDKRLSGKDALLYLRAAVDACWAENYPYDTYSKDSPCYGMHNIEILWRGPLPIRKAKLVVDNGKIMEFGGVV